MIKPLSCPLNKELAPFLLVLNVGARMNKDPGRKKWKEFYERRNSMKQRVSYLGTMVILILWSLGMAPMPAEVQKFKTVYDQHCLECHGTKGQGDGPEARTH